MKVREIYPELNRSFYLSLLACIRDYGARFGIVSSERIDIPVLSFDFVIVSS